MSGVTKHIYDRDIQDILAMWTKQLKCIKNVLPVNYSHSDIVDALKTYFPHDWNSVEMKYEYYTQKDKYLKKRFGQTRYNMVSVEQLLKQTKEYKKIMSLQVRIQYADYFSENIISNEKHALWEKREPKIRKIDEKIDKAKSKVQQVTPAYIDQLIGFYERKNTSQKDKVYILAELKKYYSPKIVQFFYKLNDIELNKQLRGEAFDYLQSFNYNPRKRRQKYMQVHTKNKKRKNYLKNIYPNEKYSIIQTPDELEYRINNSKEQKIKKYDYFISHSYKNSIAVQKLIQYENSKGKDVFCDWINDSDYLKRNLLCEATLSVIEKRLEQSDALIFVKSDESMSSVWCKYELNYFYGLGKPIYVLTIQDIEDSRFLLKEKSENWFLDPNYRKIILVKK